MRGPIYRKKQAEKAKTRRALKKERERLRKLAEEKAERENAKSGRATMNPQMPWSDS